MMSTGAADASEHTGVTMGREDVSTRLADLGESIKERYDAMIGERAELNRRIEAADRAWKKWDVDGMWRSGLLSDSEAMELDALLADAMIDVSAHARPMERVASIGRALAGCVVGPLVAAGVLTDERAGDRPDPDDAAPGSAEYYLYDPGSILVISAHWYGVVLHDKQHAVAVMLVGGRFQVIIGRDKTAARVAAVSARDMPDFESHPTLEGAIANPIRWK